MFLITSYQKISASPTHRIPKEFLHNFNSFIKAISQEANPGSFFFPEVNIPSALVKFCCWYLSTEVMKGAGPKLGTTNTIPKKTYRKLKCVLLATLATQKTQLSPKDDHVLGCDNLGKCSNKLKLLHSKSLNSLTTIYLKYKANRNIVTLSFSQNNIEQQMKNQSTLSIKTTDFCFQSRRN